MRLFVILRRSQLQLFYAPLPATDNDHLEISHRIIGKLALAGFFGFWLSMRGFYSIAGNEMGNFAMCFDNYDVLMSVAILYLLENL